MTVGAGAPLGRVAGALGRARWAAVSYSLDIDIGGTFTNIVSWAILATTSLAKLGDRPAICLPDPFRGYCHGTTVPDFAAVVDRPVWVEAV